MNATMATTNVEVWVLIDSTGDYGVGASEDAANQDFEDNIGSVQGNRRMVKLALTVPLPQPMELTATLPDDVQEPAELKVA